ncbi:helix-turn-helix domain-containing protein [Microlunatus sp. GCM10028923]|uniref:helix-turn-helix transcriptional regulator n=1 Tax=Microlunatus sp. GCM10028923 TaxID=3273400 RepID=UPI003610C03A
MVANSDTPLPTGTRPRLAFAGLMAIRPGRHQYRLPDLWSLLQVNYPARAILNGHQVQLRPGTVMIMEPGVPKDYRHTRASSHYVAHFRCPAPPPDAPRVPMAFDPGDLAAGVRDRFAVVTRCFAEDRDRAEIALWDLLFLIGDAYRPAGPPDVIATLVERIEANLHTRLSVRDLVASTGYSHGHLLALFRQAQGDSIVGYIRRRRMQQAQQLLATDMPIAVIAGQLGMPDLQAFNKAVRQHFGCGPRELRARLR